jgi:5-methylcytosine-specific restriction endonuclease McrA
LVELMWLLFVERSAILSLHHCPGVPFRHSLVQARVREENDDVPEVAHYMWKHREYRQKTLRAIKKYASPCCTHFRCPLCYCVMSRRPKKVPSSLDQHFSQWEMMTLSWVICLVERFRSPEVAVTESPWFEQLSSCKLWQTREAEGHASL